MQRYRKERKVNIKNIHNLLIINGYKCFTFKKCETLTIHSN